MSQSSSLNARIRQAVTNQDQYHTKSLRVIAEEKPITLEEAENRVVEKIKELRDAVDVRDKLLVIDPSSIDPCSIIHSTDFNGKCFGCGKQIW